MNAHDGAGYTYFVSGDHGSAVVRFRKALELFPEHARSLVGLGAALAGDGETVAADAAFARASQAIEALRRGGRSTEAAMADAIHHAVRGKPEDAVTVLDRLLDRAELSFAGWSVPIEPFLAPLKGAAGFQAVLAKLAERAR